MQRLAFVFMFFALISVPAQALDVDKLSAKELFGRQTTPAAGAPKVFGGYAKGCLAGAVELPKDGPNWQAMRPSRNRAWGHPELVDFVKDLATQGQSVGWPGLLVGDMAQARGGRMLTGHRSHQSGLDADIWLTPMPDRRLSVAERNEMSATEVVANGPYSVKSDVWTAAHFNIIKTAASHPKVDRVLVAAGIKKALCEMETGDRAWLRTVRPYWGHNYHMHVRLKCPKDSPECKPQEAKTSGDGCDDQLAWWFTDEPWKKAKPKPEDPTKPKPKPKPFPVETISSYPPQCRAVVLDGGSVVNAMVNSQKQLESAAPMPARRPAELSQ